MISALCLFHATTKKIWIWEQTTTPGKVKWSEVRSNKAQGASWRRELQASRQYKHRYLSLVSIERSELIRFIEINAVGLEQMENHVKVEVPASEVVPIVLASENDNAVSPPLYATAQIVSIDDEYEEDNNELYDESTPLFFGMMNTTYGANATDQDKDDDDDTVPRFRDWFFAVAFIAHLCFVFFYIERKYSRSGYDNLNVNIASLEDALEMVDDIPSQDLQEMERFIEQTGPYMNTFLERVLYYTVIPCAELSFVFVFVMLAFVIKPYTRMATLATLSVMVVGTAITMIFILTPGPSFFSFIIFCFIVGGLVYFLKIVWPMIPYASINLKCALHGLHANSGTYLLALLFAELSFAWIAYWFYIFLGTAFYYSEHCDEGPPDDAFNHPRHLQQQQGEGGLDDASGDCKGQGANFWFLILSLYWTSSVILVRKNSTAEFKDGESMREREREIPESVLHRITMHTMTSTRKRPLSRSLPLSVFLFLFCLFCFLLFSFHPSNTIQNTVQVLVAGVIATWCFNKQEASGCCSAAVWDSLHRSVTYSFGAVCFGSLFQGLIGACRTLVCHKSSGRQNHHHHHHPNGRDGGSGLFCCCILECLTKVLDDLLLYFNQWAYVFVGIYGYPYLKSGRKVMKLLDERGLQAVTGERLSSYVLHTTTFVTGIVSGFLAIAIDRIVTSVHDDSEFDSFIYGPLESWPVAAFL